MRRPADVRRDRRCARHGLINTRQPRIEPEGNIIRRDIDIHHTVKIYGARRGERSVALLSRETVNRQHVVGEGDIQRRIGDGIACDRTCGDLTRHTEGWIIPRPADPYMARHRPADAILLLIAQREERPDIEVLHIHGAAQHIRVRVIVQARRYLSFLPLMEARAVERDDAVLIVDETVYLRQRHAVHRHLVRLQIAAEDGIRNCPADLSVEHTVPCHRIGEFMRKPFEVQIAHLSVEIELSLRTDCAVQHHVHHWGVDVKDLQTDDAVIEEVVAVHAREQCARIAAAIEMHVADGVGIVERPREFDDVVNVARDRLVGRNERRDILHTRPHRVDLHIDAPLARKADRAIDEPDLAPIPLHRKIMDADARERALCAEDQAVKGLIHQLSARRRHLHLHVWIRDIAVHLAADVRDPRKAETIIEAV